MRELKYPAIYRHFKNKYYATMGVSKPINSNEVITLCKLLEKDPLSMIIRVKWKLVSFRGRV